ncbi:MAG: hypothetical protein KDA57_19280 [Planctomycetales bacterium]|nr:hypothetical protein [Planctomycetales bacterium]
MRLAFRIHLWQLMALVALVAIGMGCIGWIFGPRFFVPDDQSILVSPPFLATDASGLPELAPAANHSTVRLSDKSNVRFNSAVELSDASRHRLWVDLIQTDLRRARIWESQELAWPTPDDGPMDHQAVHRGGQTFGIAFVCGRVMTIAELVDDREQNLELVTLLAPNGRKVSGSQFRLERVDLSELTHVSSGFRLVELRWARSPDEQWECSIRTSSRLFELRRTADNGWQLASN